MCLKLLRLIQPPLPPQLRQLLPPLLWFLALLLMLPHPQQPLLLLLLLPFLWPSRQSLPRPKWFPQMKPLMMRLRWPLPWMSAWRLYYPRLKMC
ncbi:hypothetical protein N5C79_20175 [Pantoea brenneri]|uniref:hypothetical protein n=1 Tax=Pantoea brenneri TaxID=472694 RepID=UPI0024477A7F|nr:hypothetical protein [Pantoea brenneri]MDH1088822.1 hypothetical protein [Pantoea brenneri]